MGVRRYDYLTVLIEKRKPKVLYDIGVHDGKRSCGLIKSALKYNADLMYLGFDLWEDITSEDVYGEFLHPKKVKIKSEAEKNISESLPGTQYRLIQGNTKQTLSDTSLPKADFIFVDGGHSLETIDSDWRNCQRLMKSDTVIVFDDYWHDNYSAGCASLIDSLGPDFSIHLLGLDYIGSSEKPTHIISLVKVQMKG